MLNRLLLLLNSGKGTTLTELARTLDAPVLLVADMIQQLVRAGYLEESGSLADSACTLDCSSTCGAPQGCLLSGLGRNWLLTEKGRARAAVQAIP